MAPTKSGRGFGWDELPPLVQEHVLRLLWAEGEADTATLMAARAVNTAWRKASDLACTALYFTTLRAVKDGLLSGRARARFPNARSLTVVKCAAVDTVVCEAARFPALTQLKWIHKHIRSYPQHAVEFPGKITDLAPRTLARLTPRLTRLELGSMTTDFFPCRRTCTLTNEGVATLSSLPLESLTLEVEESLSDDGAVALGVVTTLRELKLTNTWHLTTRGFEALAGLHQLRDLGLFNEPSPMQDFRNGEKITLLARLTALTYLTLLGCVWAPAGVQALGHLRSLHILDLGYGDFVDFDNNNPDQALQEMASQSNLPHLTELYCLRTIGPTKALQDSSRLQHLNVFVGGIP